MELTSQVAPLRSRNDDLDLSTMIPSIGSIRLGQVLFALGCLPLQAQELITPDDGSGLLTMFFKQPLWSNSNIHYNAYDGAGWTSVPGIPMRKSTNGNFSAAAGWWESLLKTSELEFVFNDNNGVWDNNDSNNYKVNSAGTWAVVSKITTAPTTAPPIVNTTIPPTSPPVPMPIHPSAEPATTNVPPPASTNVVTSESKISGPTVWLVVVLVVMIVVVIACVGFLLVRHKSRRRRTDSQAMSKDSPTERLTIAMPSDSVYQVPERRLDERRGREHTTGDSPADTRLPEDLSSASSYRRFSSESMDSHVVFTETRRADNVFLKRAVIDCEPDSRESLGVDDAMERTRPISVIREEVDIYPDTGMTAFIEEGSIFSPESTRTQFDPKVTRYF